LTGEQSEGIGGPRPGRANATAVTRDTESLARIVFVLLVLACFAAFFVAQRLKHTPTAVQNFKLAGHFSPYAPTGHNLEAISFKLAEADDVTVAVVNSSGDTVATLLSHYPVVRYKQFSLRWNGHRGNAVGYERLASPDGRTILLPNNRGAVAPPGEYRVEVNLHKQDRTVSSPHSFTLEHR
jgi:hypothetical protein